MLVSNGKEKRNPFEFSLKKANWTSVEYDCYDTPSFILQTRKQISRSIKCLSLGLRDN